MLQKVITFSIVSLFAVFSLVVPVFAGGTDAVGITQSGGDGNCIFGDSVFKGFCNSEAGRIAEGGNAGSTVATVFTTGIQLFFFVVIAIAVIYTLRAALKYVRAEGNEKEVGAAKESMKSILMGVGAMFVGLLGIVIVTSIFASYEGGLAKPINDFLNPILKLFGRGQ